MLEIMCFYLSIKIYIVYLLINSYIIKNEDVLIIGAYIYMCVYKLIFY